jgi:hypothetical protein
MSKDDGLAPSAQMLILFLYICRQAFKETRIQMIDDTILALHEQTAKELGQIVERHEVAEVDSYQFKSNEDLQAELMQILAKRHAAKQSEKPEDAPC